MIRFEDQGSQVVLIYGSDGPITWVDDKLSSEGKVTLSRVFTVQFADLLGTNDHSDEDLRRFVVGSIEGIYRRIGKDVLGIKHDLMIATSLQLERRTFVAERNISVFRKIDELINETDCYWW